MGKIFLTIFLLPLFSQAQTTTAPRAITEDKYLWLENVQDTKSLSWVQQQNAETLKALTGTDRFKDLQKNYIDILNKKDFLTLWRADDDVFYTKKDSDHPRGQLLMVPRKDFKGENSSWKLLLDLDELSRAESASYILKSARRLRDTQKALIFLSVQGRDETIVREFDLDKAEFVKDGFQIPQSKTDTVWLDKDTLIIAYNEGPDSITKSGYPRRVRFWKRGTALKDAELIQEFPVNSVGAGPVECRINGKTMVLVNVYEENGDRKIFSLDEENKKLTQWPLHPRAAVLECFKDKVLVRLEKEWDINGKKYLGDSILSFLKSELDAGKIQSVSQVFKPNGKIFPQEVFVAKDKVIMTALKNAEPSLFEAVANKKSWSLKKIKTEKNVNYEKAWSDDEKNDVWFMVDGYASPAKLVEMNMTTEKRTTLQEKKIDFSLKDVEVKRYWVTSKDGAKVPYTVIALKQTTKTKGPRPTIQYGYGGFRISETPFFSEGIYRSWIMRGGVFVSTQIRGGLEFGEEWHQQAIRENKQNVFNDFIAISEDLIQKNITTKDMLAIQGGSNGGLLVSAVAVQRPDLYKAVVCQVPLTDMLRFHLLLAGSSWIDEYGDPDNAKDRLFIEKYSPYQNLKEGVKMPKFLFMTSTNDDRVHPGHARKMAAKMMEYGYAPYFYEEMEGGHGGGTPVEVRAKNQALPPEFLSQLLNLQSPASAR